MEVKTVSEYQLLVVLYEYPEYGVLMHYPVKLLIEDYTHQKATLIMME